MDFGLLVHSNVRRIYAFLKAKERLTGGLKHGIRL